MTSCSGRCLCGDVSWRFENEALGQVLVCHCEMCRRVSGAMAVPYAGIVKEGFERQVDDQLIERFQSSNVAWRGFCRRCRSYVYMDYGEEHTIWITMGSLVGFEPSWLDGQRDSQLFCEEKSRLEEGIQRLPQMEAFGSYRLDPCSGKRFEELMVWNESNELKMQAEGDE